MGTSVQLNTRIDPELKRRGDAVFAREGLTSSEVVRAVWEYAATRQKAPDCVRKGDASELEQRLGAVREGAGVARKVAMGLGLRLVPASVSYETLRDEMYDDMLGSIDEQLA